MFPKILKLSFLRKQESHAFITVIPAQAGIQHSLSDGFVILNEVKNPLCLKKSAWGHEVTEQSDNPDS